jgi:hypothetical protein
MIWIFVLGIIAIAVYHEGFRKLLLWCGGAVVAITIVIFLAHGTS